MNLLLNQLTVGLVIFYLSLICKESEALLVSRKISQLKWTSKAAFRRFSQRTVMKCHSMNDEVDMSAAIDVEEVKYVDTNRIEADEQIKSDYLTDNEIKNDLRIEVVEAELPDGNTSSTGSLLKDIFSVAVPALAACIVEPALSLVDTYYVGKVAATATMGLAGMSINGALFNIIAAATAPLGTGTTAVISRIRGKEEQKAKEKSQKNGALSVAGHGSESSVGDVFMNGIFLAGAAGTILSSLCCFLGKPFVRQVFQIKDGLLAATVGYLRIRGLSLPSVLLNYIVFGFSIAMQDAIAPILSIVTAFFINVLGDYVLVGRMGYGLSGAAVATTLSSYLGSFVALKHLFKKYNIELPRNAAKESAAKEIMISTRSVEDDKKVAKKGSISWNKLLNKEGLAMFFTASGPLLAGALVNTMTYSAGARIASFTQNPALSTVEVAAHQIVMQSWWFLSYFSSPFSLVAQAVIPKDLIKNDSKRVKKMVTLLLQLTGIVGVLVTILNALLISQFPSTFTKNIGIQEIVRTVLMPSSLSLFIICMSTVSDGIFIGCNVIQDYLKASVLSTAAAWIYFSYAIRNRIGLLGAWNGLLIFSVVRMAYYLTRFSSLWSSVDKNSSRGGCSGSNGIIA